MEFFMTIKADTAGKSYKDLSITLKGTLQDHFVDHLVETVSPDALIAAFQISEMILDEVTKYYRPISIAALDELITSVASETVREKNSFLVVQTLVREWIEKMDKSGWKVDLNQYAISSRTCSWRLSFSDGKGKHLPPTYSFKTLVQHAALKFPAEIYALPVDYQSLLGGLFDIEGYLIRKVGRA
jgi:hypothetical protein